MQLVRLCRQGMEILQTGEINVFRSDREELIAIRNGTWTYDQVLEYAQKCEQDMVSLCEKSTLPKQPNRNELDKLCVSVIERYVFT